MKRVCLITPGHISTNPRLVKEARTLSDAGYSVHILFTQYVPYQIEFDNNILNEHPEWTFEFKNWSGNSLIAKIIRFKIWALVFFSRRKEVIINRNFFWQKQRANACRADLYIAHNLGAIAVAVHAAKRNHTKSGFDAEDFHRFETTDNEHDSIVVLNTYLEEKYIPQVDYLTASSPLIADAYADIFKRPVTAIRNVFPKTTHNAKKVDSAKNALKLFWFSQTIGPNRGLETVINAIKLSGIKVELHLLGNSSTEYMLLLKRMIEPTRSQLNLHPPVDGEDIFNIASQLDIGLAAEPCVPKNRNICLTNKIFTYIQSGLAVLATRTSAQELLMNEHNGIGILYNDASELADAILKYDINRDLLSAHKTASRKVGQALLNWDLEQNKFINIVEELFSK